MRQAARVVLAVAALAAPAGAQGPVPVPAAPPPVPPQPIAWALKLFDVEGKVQGHDFGPVANGVLLVHRFPVSNIYAVPLTFRASTSCGCVDVKPPSVLQPRETGFVDVTMDTRRIQPGMLVNGVKSVNAYVTVGHPQFTSTATLVIACRPRFDVVVNPQLAQFGAVPRGQTPSQTVKVEYAGPNRFEVLPFEPRPELPVDVTIAPLYRQPGKVGYTVQLTVKPDAPANAYKQELNLQTNDPSTPVLPVSFDLTVRPTLSVTPPLQRDDNLKVGVAVTKKVLVRSGDNKPFRITGVDNQGDGVSVELLPTPVPVQVVTVKIQPMQAGPLSRKLIFHTDLGADAVATLQVEGTAKP